MTFRCAVVGASGYAGAELIALLAGHPEVQICAIQADTSAGLAWESLFPQHAHRFCGTIAAFDPASLAGLDVVFLALPHGASARAAAQLHGKVGHIIDLSGDLRLADPVSYKHWYGFDHPAPQLLGEAAYGLPELFGADLPGARLVACAGCYATVAQLATAPALGLGDAVGSSVSISAMSGTSGAGRKADVSLSFTEVAGSVRAYRIGHHQHVPEITNGLQRASGRSVRVTFVPHLLPIPRGILATVIVQNPGAVTQDALLDAYRTAYAGSAFVRIVDPRLRLPSISDIVGQNFCDLAPFVDEQAGTLVIIGVLDNLVKGAAGQAVQVMNHILSIPETLGILSTFHSMPPTLPGAAAC